MDNPTSPRNWTVLAVTGVALLGLGIAWALRSRPAEPLPPPPVPVKVATKPAIPKQVPPARPGPDSSTTNSDPAQSAPPAALHSPREIAALEARVLNVNLPPDERVRSLRQLRYLGDAWKSPAIIQSMTLLLASEGSDMARANICRLLRESEDPHFRQQLLTVATQDRTKDMREEAVRALRYSASDPHVQMVLKRALETEQSSGVRREIEMTLHAAQSPSPATPADKPRGR